MDPVGVVLSVVGLSTILFVGVYFTIFLHAVDRSYVERYGESYARGVNERFRLFLIRSAGAASLVGLVLLCALFVWSSSSA